MNRTIQSLVVLGFLLLAPPAAHAQRPGDHEVEKIKKNVALMFAAKESEILDIAPILPRPGVRNAPFTADAVTEFTQVLGDGNRIERLFTTSIARDSRGRTRREQEVAMLGALASLQAQQPRLVVISDPATGSDYTLDERTKTARQQRSVFQIKARAADSVAVAGTLEPLAAYRAEARKVLRVSDAGSKVTTEQLGSRQIEGVTADGTRTTMTFAAGAMGNLNPIDVVTERWFSNELQMEVLISRRDPRSGDTVYRLTNIVRNEPPADLFVVPPDYTIQQPALARKVLELDKVKRAVRRK
jgi:hypothetical protein